MPPTTPHSNPRKKPVKKIKILQVKRTEQKSLLSEHFYPFLGILFVVATFFLTAFGLHFYESAIVGLWIVGIIFFVKQVVQYIKGTPAPKKEEKKPLASMPPQSIPRPLYPE